MSMISAQQTTRWQREYYVDVADTLWGLLDKLVMEIA